MKTPSPELGFRVTQRESLLIPFGDYTHKLGLQRFDKAAADAIAANMSGLAARLSHGFAGVPVYVGHPDLPGADGAAFPDRKAYARIRSARVTPEGLQLDLRWSNAGWDLIEQGHYAHYSPYWGMVEIGKTPSGLKIARPVRLYSVGLTNEPNIPVPALIAANERDVPENPAHDSASDVDAANEGRRHAMEFLKIIAVALGLAESATEDECVAAAEGGKKAAASANDALTASKADAEKAKTDLAAANARADQAAAQLAEQGKTLAAANTRADQAESGLKAERAARATVLIDAAIADGRVIAADKDRWANEFAQDPAAAGSRLAAQPKVMKTSAATVNLGVRKAVNVARQTVLDAVNERMKTTGEPYTTAWENTKRLNPELFAAMK